MIWCPTLSISKIKTLRWIQKHKMNKKTKTQQSFSKIKTLFIFKALVLNCYNSSEETKSRVQETEFSFTPKVATSKRSRRDDSSSGRELLLQQTLLLQKEIWQGRQGSVSEGKPM
eukprot:TRINITY_DN1566_c0_g1_i7.p2 TRINITY_DN1566_c0_g1~~TRINITY_DN1566_c0_g1_i7.p2  ORF type:complete len:115 (+),score=12.93 TRINITY_DN1566_c0_g1_i7:199-543(+)